MSADVNPRRRYVSPRRQQSAADTRQRIVAAARDLFVARGYAGTTVAQVALHAEVALKTVYLVFPGKPALLDAVIGTALAGDDRPLQLRDRAWFQQTTHAPADEMLDLFARYTTELMQRAAAILQMAEAAADADPAIRDQRERARRGRWADMRAVAAAIAPALTERPVDEVADILYTHASVHNYLSLVHERQWPADQYTAWLAASLRGALLDDRQQARTDSG